MINTKLFEPKNLLVIGLIALGAVWLWHIVGNHISGIPQSMKGL